ncbi:MAG TPA: carbohydrate porin, partial [Caulobacteraceae bacterium]|nr:carbohydrate porin [Caulobacteraceae bacterium]
MPLSAAATVALAAVGLVAPCRADPASGDAAAPSETTAPDKVWAIHVQATDVLQYHPAFRSPFEGPNSLSGREQTANTVNASFFAGLRPWRGGQFWFDLDMNQGFAPSNTLGVAGYVNGEGAKVGHHSPYFRPQRLFYRQIFELGGGEDDIDPDLFEFGGKTTRNRLTLTVGKF